MLERGTPSVVVPSGVLDLRAGVLQPERGAPVSLTSREHRLVTYLAQRPGQDVSRDELLREVWGYSGAVLTRAVDATVSRLRAKIEQTPRSPRCLLTAHGEGYRFVPVGAEVPASVAGPADRAASVGAALTLEGGALVDTGRLVVERGGERGTLTTQEGAILEVLAGAEGRVVEPAKLCREALGGASRRALVHAISRLRVKIEPAPSAPVALLSVRGKGYRLALRPAELAAPGWLLGREETLEALVGLLGRERIVTLVGPGGVGKSTLARAATAMAGQTRRVALDTLTRPEEACEALADALGLERAPPTLRGLGGVLDAAGALLLVLDGAEQLAAPLAEAIGGWLERAPHLRLLVTSQVPLGAPGERRLPVSPLPSDGPAAIALLLAAARRAAPGFEAPPESAADLEAIAAATGGLPLALALAGGRLALLGPAGLRARLDRALGLLETGDPGREARHRSIRACLEVSWGLLPDSARGLLEGLSLLEWPADAAAAEALAPAPGAALGDVELLVSRGLLWSADGGARLSMMPLVRAYGREQLERDPQRRGACWRRVAAHLSRHFDALPPDLLLDAEATRLLPVWRRELPGLRAAAREAAALGERALAARCAVLASLAGHRHSPGTVAPTLAPLLADPPGDDALAAQLWLRAAMAGAGPGAESCLERALEPAERSGLHPLIAAVRWQGFLTAYERGRLTPAQRAAALSELRGFLAEAPAPLPQFEAAALLFEAFSHVGQASQARAHRLCARALALLERADLPWLRYRALRTAAYVCMQDGRLEAAEGYLDRGLALAERCGLPQAGMLSLMGRMQARQGRTGDAERNLTLALRQARRSGIDALLVEALIELGRCAMIAGEPEEVWGWLQSAALEAERAALPLAGAIVRCLEGLTLAREGDREGGRQAIEQGLAVLERAEGADTVVPWRALRVPLLPPGEREEAFAALEGALARPDPETALLLALARASARPEEAAQALARAQAIIDGAPGRISPDFLRDYRAAAAP